jgi:ACS family hexuronate transporter-like MFS transporter
MRLRWVVAWFLFFGGMINYLDRAVLSITAPLISKEFGFTPEQLGWIFSSFFIGYSLFSFVGGALSDRFGGKRVFGVAMAAWSGFCAMTALSSGFWSLFGFRALFGIGEGPMTSTLNKVVNNWFPRDERATAVGFTSAGQPLGGAVAGPIAGYLAITYGWRASFIGVGLLGLLWTVLWAWLITDKPAHHPRISARELEEIAAPGSSTVATGSDAPAMPLFYYLRQPTVLATAFAFFGFAYTVFFFLSWFPSYLTMAHHLSLKDMSITNVIPWAVGACGLLAGGFICDALSKRIGNALLARKIVLVTCLGGAAVCVAIAGLVTDLVQAVALMTVAVTFLFISGNSYWAILQDTIPPSRMGGVGGFVAMLATTSGIIGPAITGYLVQASGAFTSAFILAGAISLGGALLVAVFVRPITGAVNAASRPVLAEAAPRRT